MDLKTVMEALTGKIKPTTYNEIPDLIQTARPLIFDFLYPLFENSYRETLETKILQYFLFYEICDTPIPRWKIWLERKMNEIMPYYNQLYESEKLKIDPLSTMSYKRDGNSNETETKSREDVDISNTEREVQGSGKTVGKSDSKNVTKHSDTPQGTLTGLENDTYMSDATIATENGNSDQENTLTTNETGKTNRDFNSDEERYGQKGYVENMSGYNGKSPAELLQLYRQTFINIDRMVIDELRDCFMGVL